MNLDTMRTDELAVPVSRFYKLARLLLAENPLEGEFRTVEVPELRKMMKQRNGAIKLVQHRGKLKHANYIVVQNGTPFTTSRLPRGINKKDVVEAHITNPEPTLLPQFIEACKALEKVSSGTYSAFRCAEILRLVSGYYQDRKTDEPWNDLVAYSHISEITHEWGDPAQSPDRIGKWAFACANGLLQEYARFSMAGDSVRRAFATLLYFAISPAPDQLFLLGTRGTASLGNDDTAKQIVSLPILDVGFYLTHPEIVGVQTFVPARRAARFIHRQADDWQRQARVQSGFTRFHDCLYKALVYYRSAMVLYDALLLKEMVKAIPADLRDELLPDLDDLRRDRAACEERRVAILASFAYVLNSQPGTPNFTDGIQFLDWLDLLSRVEFEKAEMHIHDFFMRLIYPKFLRDLALGSIQIGNSATLEEGIVTLKAVAEFLDQNLAANMAVEEVNYLSRTYEYLSLASERAGRMYEAKFYAARSTPDYIQARTDEVFGNIG